MTEVSNLVSELRSIHGLEDAWHGPGLKKILTGISAAKALECPLPDYRSIWELVLHISKWEEVFRIRLEGQLISEPEEGDWPPVYDRTEAAWQQALKFLDAAHERLIDVVSNLNDSDLTRPVPGKDYDLAYMLHGIVRHHVYHAGQIALLKRTKS
jgi:uncharacterized damage-inducible protein DinB